MGFPQRKLGSQILLCRARRPRGESTNTMIISVRMYKARFQQWGIQKKIRAEDAVEIFRQQSARAAAGKSSVFYIGGCKINPDRLRRYRCVYDLPTPVFRSQVFGLDMI